MVFWFLWMCLVVLVCVDVCLWCCVWCVWCYCVISLWVVCMCMCVWKSNFCVCVCWLVCLWWMFVCVCVLIVVVLWCDVVCGECIVWGRVDFVARGFGTRIANYELRIMFRLYLWCVIEVWGVEWRNVWELCLLFEGF